MKKLAALFLVLIMMTGTALADTSVLNTESVYPVVKSELTLNMLGPRDASQGEWQDLKFFKKWQEITGVTLNIETVPEDNWATAINLRMMEEGNLPDFIYAGGITAAQEVDWGDDQGILLPLEDLIPQYMPNLSALLDADPVLRSSITTPAGITYDATKWNAVSGNTWENDKSGYGSHYAYVTNVPVGSVLKLRTTLGSTYDSTYGFDNKPFKDTHYLKAYSFNGKTYELHQWNESGVYEEDWVVEQVNTANMKKEGDNDRPVVEITPIYYLKDNTYTKTFYIDGYEGLLSEKWGNMLAVYPYYSGSSDKKNAFGGYPGQPMLYWGGKYQMEIPITVDGTANGKEVKGLTMHNAYWDLLHRKLDKSCDDGHCQTYDYDDFYKIYKEKNADTIFFRYKYFPKKDYTYNGSTISAGKDNYGDKYEYENRTFAGNSAKSAANFTGSNGNGVEVVTDFYGRQIDAFGTILTDSQKSDYDMTGSQTKELLFVSSGYKNTYVGHYATIWAVYAPQEGMKGGDSAGKLIGYISSSMLYLNNIGRVSQYSGGTNTASGKMSWSVFKNTYNHLKQYYEGVPALISYEKEIHNDSLDQADRSDGKWYYSTTGDRLTANIKIQYTSATGTYPAIDAVGSNLAAQWVEDPFDGTKTGAGSEHNIGTSTGCSAYFTNTTPEYLYGKVRAEDIIADNESQFSFMATAASGYKFVGWVRYSDGKYYEITSKDGLGQSNMSANDTYIARFVPQAKGSLVVSHNIMKDATHTGDGTKYLKVEVLKSDNTVVKTYEKTDGTDIDVSKYIGSDYSTYKLRITLATEPDEDCAVAERTVDLGADEKYDRYRTNSDNTAINYGLPVSSSYTSTLLLNISDIYDNTNGVTALRYTTMLTKTPVNYAYEIVYHYTSRFWGGRLMCFSESNSVTPSSTDGRNTSRTSPSTPGRGTTSRRASFPPFTAQSTVTPASDGRRNA